MNKFLFFLPDNKAWVRVLRRSIIIFFLSGLSTAIVNFLQYNEGVIPDIWIPILTGLLAGLDKAMREYNIIKK